MEADLELVLEAVNNGRVWGYLQKPWNNDELRILVEQASQMRRDFVANVSHELRTPLTALMGFIETLRGRGLRQLRSRYLRRALGTGRTGHHGAT